MLPSLALGAAPRHAAPLSARQAFALIPTEIFENTRAPLTEDERELLADQGVNAHWSIAEDSPDALRFSSADGFPDVCLRLFRSERGAVAAFRTEDDDGVCISELWYISAKGHAAPLPLPPEPPVDDFFPARARPAGASFLKLHLLRVRQWASKCCPPSPPTACPARSTRTTPCITSGTAEPSSKK